MRNSLGAPCEEETASKLTPGGVLSIEKTLLTGSAVVVQQASVLLLLLLLFLQQ